MAFEWNRIHKHEEQIEQDVTDRVYQYVCEYYDVDDIAELTKEQHAELVEYWNDANQYSVMLIGFSNLINQWEDENG